MLLPRGLVARFCCSGQGVLEKMVSCRTVIRQFSPEYHLFFQIILIQNYIGVNLKNPEFLFSILSS
jgi:hypothetical protein